MHVFGRREEDAVPGENPKGHAEDMQTPFTSVESGIEPMTHDLLRGTLPLCTQDLSLPFVINMKQ